LPGFLERLLIPAFVFFFFMLYPPRWVADAASRTAAAAGGCMLVSPRRARPDRRIDSIRHEIIDDCALARRSNRRPVWLGATTDTYSLRSTGMAAIWDMIARCAFAQPATPPFALIAMVL